MAYPNGDKEENLDEWFPRDAHGQPLIGKVGRLGVVVGGSLSKGLVVKLDSGQSVEDLAVGRYVVVHGDRKRFFCMLTDVELNSANPSIQNDPPDIADPFMRDVYSGTAAYGTIHVAPMLSIEEGKPRPVKTIPSHFMEVYNATA